MKERNKKKKRQRRERKDKEIKKKRKKRKQNPYSFARKTHTQQTDKHKMKRARSDKGISGARQWTQRPKVEQVNAVKDVHYA